MDNKKQYYINKEWSKEYVNRVIFYRQRLQGAFPDKFEWDIDGEQVKEMVRCEIRLTHLDRQIVNEGNKDGFLYVPKHLLKQEDDLRKALNVYRRGLMMVLDVRTRNSVNIGNKKSQKDVLKEMFAKADEDLTE